MARTKPKASAVLDIVGLCGPDPDGEKIAQHVRETRNVARLVRYLRGRARVGGVHIGPRLAALLADILDGSQHATVKRQTRDIPPDELARWLAVGRDLLAEGDSALRRAARELGYTDAQIADGRERKSIAKSILADRFGIGVHALDDRIKPRAGRGKKG